MNGTTAIRQHIFTPLASKRGEIPRFVLALSFLFSLAIFGASGSVAGNNNPAMNNSAPQPIPEEKSEPVENTSTTSLSVNGQSVSIPANGTFHQEINDDTSHTSVDVESHHSSSGGSNQSTTNMEVKINR